MLEIIQLTENIFIKMYTYFQFKQYTESQNIPISLVKIVRTLSSINKSTGKVAYYYDNYTQDTAIFIVLCKFALYIYKLYYYIYRFVDILSIQIVHFISTLLLFTTFKWRNASLCCSHVCICTDALLQPTLIHIVKCWLSWTIYNMSPYVFEAAFLHYLKDKEAADDR